MVAGHNFQEDITTVHEFYAKISVLLMFIIIHSEILEELSLLY